MSTPPIPRSTQAKRTVDDVIDLDEEDRPAAHARVGPFSSDHLDSDRPPSPTSKTRIHADVARIIGGFLDPDEIATTRKVNSHWWKDLSPAEITARGGLKCVLIKQDYPRRSIPLIGRNTEEVHIIPRAHEYNNAHKDSIPGRAYSFPLPSHIAFDDNLVGRDYEGMNEVLEFVSRTCPNLHTMNLGCTYWGRYASVGWGGLRGVVRYGVTNQTVCAIAERCKQLRVFRAERAGLLSDDALIAIANGCRELENLDIRTCIEFTDRSMEAIAQNCHALKKLRVSGCTLIRDASILAIARGCPGLTHLNVSDCREITDTAIIGISTQCPHLAELDMSWNPQFTHLSVEAVAQNCKNLTKLVLPAADGIDDEALTAIRNGCTALVDLYISLGVNSSITDAAMDRLIHERLDVDVRYDDKRRRRFR